MKVISKKLITLSTKKVQGRNAAAAGLRTENVPSNVTGLSHLNPDSKSVSATRPAALNLNFNVATNVVGAQPIPVVATVKNKNHHHSSALSRFNASNSGQTKKQGGGGGISVMNTHRQNTQLQKSSPRAGSDEERIPDDKSSAEPPIKTNSGLPQPQNGQQFLGSITIRQEASPKRTAYNS